MFYKVSLVQNILTKRKTHLPLMLSNTKTTSLIISVDEGLNLCFFLQLPSLLRVSVYATISFMKDMMYPLLSISFITKNINQFFMKVINRLWHSSMSSSLGSECPVYIIIPVVYLEMCQSAPFANLCLVIAMLPQNSIHFHYNATHHIVSRLYVPYLQIAWIFCNWNLPLCLKLLSKNHHKFVKWILPFDH